MVAQEVGGLPGPLVDLYGLSQGHPFVTIELEVARILDKLGKEGLRVDIKVLRGQERSLTKTLETKQAHINRLAKREIRPGSGAELVALLFDQLALTPLKVSKKTGRPSVADDVLQKYKDIPLVQEIREWKSARYTLSYLQSMEKAVGSDDRIRTTFKPWCCPTGRVYSENISFTQIPVPGRRAILPEEGYRFLYADYNQFEYRILMSMAGQTDVFDKVMNCDVHKLTAARMFGIEPEAVNKDQREVGKMCNYAIPYQVTADSLAMQSGRSVEVCREFIRAYFTGYPKVAEWVKGIKAQVKKEKKVKTYFGHTRDLATDYKNDPQKAYREGVNTPIQGTAGGFFKKGIVNIGSVAGTLGWKFAMGVFDSFLVQVPIDVDPAKAEALLKACVEFNEPNWIPLTVATHWGNNWAEAAHSDVPPLEVVAEEQVAVFG